MKLKTEILSEIRVCSPSPKMDNAEPILVTARMLKELPKSHHLKTETADPRRTNDLSDNEDPKTTESIILAVIVLPILANPWTERADPSRTKLLVDKADAKAVKSRTDIAVPIRTEDLKLRLDPR
jgi:hypothetical protein